MDRSGTEGLSKSVRKHHVLIFSDEIHSDLIMESLSIHRLLEKLREKYHHGLCSKQDL